MPNWCTNIIKLRNTSKAMVEPLITAFKTKEFCNAVIPIPEDYLDDDFCFNKWGTKWDVDSISINVDHDGLGFEAFFYSAWSPPIRVYEALVEQGFEIEAYYYEPGVGFAGSFKNGVDRCVDVDGGSADNIFTDNPVLVEQFPQIYKDLYQEVDEEAEA